MVEYEETNHSKERKEKICECSVWLSVCVETETEGEKREREREMRELFIEFNDQVELDIGRDVD